MAVLFAGLLPWAHAGCGAAPAGNAGAAAPFAAGPDVFRFHIGALEATALRDGALHEKNDGTSFGLGHAPADVTAVLRGAGVTSDTIDMSIQPLLVKDGARVLLFDTGAANVSWAPDAGRLASALRSAGVAPGAVTDIFISHGHPDHVGSLLTADGALAFPAAVVHLSAPEWEWLQKDPASAALVRGVRSHVAPFAPGAALLSTVTAVPVNGHTPGHTAYAIRSGSEQLLYIGDSAHSSVVSLAQPDWLNEYDTDQETARASRRALLTRAAAENLRIYAVHFPFPGVGHVRAAGQSFAWAPE
ncbi:MAG: hypothetical protein JWP97_785 [Labilithrix sp.]|nr:hypothetical protein [Labilithrix sp.]